MVAKNLAPIIPAFFTGPGGERLTPDQIKRRQEIAQSLLGQATDASPNAGGWASILSKTGLGLLSGYQSGKAERGETKNAEASKENLQKMYGSLIGGTPAATAPAMGGLPPAMAAGTGVGAEMAATAPGATVPTTADAQQIRQGLINRGLPEHVADGFLVNFQDESGLNPGINEANPTVPGSRGGFGLYQLTGPRRVAYESFAKERGVDPSDVDAQLDFLMTELQGPEKAAAERIMAAGDTPMAAQAIVNHFLRPAPEHRERRMAAYSQLGASPAVMTDEAPASYQDPMVASPNASPVAAALATQPAAAMGMPQQQMAQAMPQQMQPQASAPTLPPINPAVIETLSSPYASPEEKAVAQALLGDYQQQKAQIEQQAQAEQQRQMEIQRRQQIAQQTGINPAYATDDEIWKGAAGNLFAPPSTSTVNGAVIDNRTGQPIYQAPAETYRQVYGEEAAAMGLDPSKAYNIGPNGEVRPIGEGGVVVNNNMGNDKFGEEFAKLDASALNTVSTAGLAAQRNLGRINQLEELLASSPSGLAGAAAQRAGEWGINTEGLDTLQAAQAAINSLVPEQRQPGSGPMSDADLALFKQSLPRIINQPGGNQLIIGTMRSIAEYDAQGAQIVQQLRDNKLTRAQAFEMLQARPNPLESFKVPAQQENPLPAQTGGTAPKTSGRLRYNPATGELE